MSWRIKLTTADGAVGWFNLGEDEDAARKLFLEIREAFERTKREPGGGGAFEVGPYRFEGRDYRSVELVEPGDAG